jgi:hypothetical protein
MPNAADIAATLALSECDTFQRNLSALALRQADLADRIRQVVPPAGACVVTGRDGWPAVRLPSSDTDLRWLGGTSMPSISAPAVLENFVDRGASVALPSIGSGYEPRVLAERIGDHSAVYVCEADPVKIALALAVVDVSEPLRSGRVVIIDSDIAESLAGFLIDHPGYDPPTQLFALPDAGGARVAAVTGAIKRASMLAEAKRRAHIQRLTETIGRLTPDPDAETPRVLVLSIDAVGGAIEFSSRIEKALGRLGWAGARCVPASPEFRGTAARLEAICSTKPDVAFFLNCAPGALRLQLPSGLLYASWFLESAALPAIALEGLVDCPHILAASTLVRDHLVARGAREESITVLETGVDDRTFFPSGETPPLDGAPCDVAVLCDGQDTTQAACNIGLQSHELLWARVTRLIEKAARTGGDLAVRPLLTTAERQTDRRLGDKALRDQFVAMITGRLVKTTVARTAIESLANVPGVAVWGANWHTHPTVRGIHRDKIPPPQERNVLYNSAKVVVLPYADPAAVHHAQEALAAGCCPIMRQPEGELLEMYPQTREIWAVIPSFSKTEGLRDTVTALLNDAAKRGEIVKSMRHKLVSQHTVADRMRTAL